MIYRTPEHPKRPPNYLRDALYVLVAGLAWVLTSYIYYHLLEVTRPSRQLVFVGSMCLVLIVCGVGLIFEDRLIWKGYFDGRYARWDVTAGGRRTAPPPLMMGVAGGLLIFFFWR